MWLVLWTFVSLGEVAAEARCSHVASSGCHMLVNLSVVDKGEAWNLQPATLYYFVQGSSPLLSSATTGSCPGDERRFSAQMAALVDELDSTSPALRHSMPGSSGLATVTATIHHVTTAADYAIVEALEAKDFGTAVKLVNDEATGINARDRFGMTPLMIGVVRQQVVLIGTLLNAYHPRVDVNATTPGGYTALHYSIGEGNLGITRALLRRGADPNARISQRDSGGWTPLHFACAFGNLEGVKLLLEFGGDPLAVGFAGESVFQVAEDAEVSYLTRKKLASVLNEAVHDKMVGSDLL